METKTNPTAETIEEIIRCMIREELDSIFMTFLKNPIPLG